MSNEERRRAHTSKELRRLVDYNNRYDGTVPREYRSLEELEVATSFAYWLEEETGIVLTDLKSNPHDPPDCLAIQGSTVVGIEITELVDPEVRRTRIQMVQQVMSSRDGEPRLQQLRDNVPALSELTLKTSLSHDRKRFLSLLAEAIQKKDEKLSRCAQQMPVYVVVFSRDLWVEERVVSSFLENVTFRADNITGAWFQGDYYDGEYPTLELPINQF